MKPTKYCNAVRCADCESYKECSQYEYDTMRLQGKIKPFEFKVSNQDKIKQ